MLSLAELDREKSMELEDFETETRWWSSVEMLTDTHIFHWIEYNRGYASYIPVFANRTLIDRNVRAEFSDCTFT